MPPDINHGDATGLVYTVQKMCIIFLVSFNDAEFPMRNQRRNASPPTTVNCTVRKYLTAREIEKLMDYARKHSRYGHRDSTMILVAYRHGLRASEVCDLQWHQVELDHGRMHVRRAKNGTPSVHPIRGDEIRALRKLRRESPTEAYVFLTERGGPMKPSASTISSRGSARPPGCLSHCILTCCGMRVAISLPTTGTIPEPYSTISATKTFSIPSAIPNFHPTGSATSGEISVDWRVADTAGRNWHGSAHLKRTWMCVRQMRPPPGRGDFGF
jgi:Phage integrase family